MKKRGDMQGWIDTARTLSQALPFMQRYDNAIIVIKLGGHAMGSDEAMQTFAREVVLMRQVGINPVIINGGGPMINQMLEKLNIKSKFVDHIWRWHIPLKMNPTFGHFRGSNIVDFSHLAAVTLFWS